MFIGGAGKSSMCCLASFHRDSGAWGVSNFGNTDCEISWNKDTGEISFNNIPPYFAAFIISDVKIEPINLE